MQINDLANRFSDSREKQMKAIFSSIFITGNRLQTIFDNDDSGVTLKQFMLLTMVRQAPKPLSFTQLGKLLGCSRQNIKKLAEVLQRKEYVTIAHHAEDVRAAIIQPTDKLHTYFEAIANSHQQQLTTLFAQYTNEEMSLFFQFMIRLYDGIDEMEKHAHE